MTKFIYSLILILCCAGVIQADGLIISAGGGGIPCTGSIIFAWHMENLDVTAGTPAGCTNNADSTVELSGTASLASDVGKYSDGSYSLKRTSNTASGTIPITGASASQEYISFDFISGSVGATSIGLVNLIYDGSNYFFIQRLTTGKLQAVLYYGGSTRNATTGTALSDDTMYHCSAYFKTSASPYIHVECDGGITAGDQINSVTAMAGAPTHIDFWGGSNTSTISYVDNLQINNVWNP